MGTIRESIAAAVDAKPGLQQWARQQAAQETKPSQQNWSYHQCSSTHQERQSYVM